MSIHDTKGMIMNILVAVVWKEQYCQDIHYWRHRDCNSQKTHLDQIHQVVTLKDNQRADAKLL